MDYRYCTLAALAGSALLASTPASAAFYTAPTEVASGEVVILEPLTFTNVGDLDFGGFVIPASGSGSVSVDAATGTATNAASLTVMPQFTQARGHFMGAGTASQLVTVTAVFPTRLYLDGNTASPDSIAVALELDVAPEIDGSYEYTIAADRVLDVYVGGDLTISAGMVPGVYSNTYDLTATYQ